MSMEELPIILFSIYSITKNLCSFERRFLHGQLWYMIDIPSQKFYNINTYLGNILIDSIDYPHMSKTKYGGWERESTYNPNMPIRGFMYAAKLYNKYIEENRLNIYSKTLMKLPIPQYIVFYNGDDKHEDEEILRLSDAFVATERTEGYEWTARMLNINYGRNKKLMEKCKPLRAAKALVEN